MANTTREGRPWGETHRADEIHVHKRPSTGKSWLPLLLLIGVLIVGLFAWSRFKRDRSYVSEPQVTPREELPGMPRSDMPAVPPIVEVPKAAEAPPAPPSEAPAAPAAGAAETATESPKCSETTVQFGMNRTEIDNDGKAALRELADCLRANPTQAVRLEGRADQRGPAARNQRLSQRRAEKVADQLADYGVSRNQLTVLAAERVCEDADESCWQKNRTVTLTLPEE